jgi:hypothetical protein
MALFEEEQHPRFFRSTSFVIFIVYITAFTCPGLYYALNNLGAGGRRNPTIVNAANAIIFGVIAVSSPFIGAIVNHQSWTWSIGRLLIVNSQPWFGLPTVHMRLIDRFCFLYPIRRGIVLHRQVPYNVVLAFRRCSAWFIWSFLMDIISGYSTWLMRRGQKMTG